MQLRARLQELPALDETRLWKVQAQAIRNLEQSFGRADPRALIQMATGSGKTFTAVNVAYRLLKFANAKRILFLVDRGNLGKQAEDEFANFEPPDDPRKFPRSTRSSGSKRTLSTRPRSSSSPPFSGSTLC
jgi:type I restriction enzyme, R subunit